MTKRDKLHAWLLAQGDWVYLSQVPHADFGMSRQSCSSELRAMCDNKRADFRVVGLKQYKANDVPASKRGPKPPRKLT